MKLSQSQQKLNNDPILSLSDTSDIMSVGWRWLVHRVWTGTAPVGWRRPARATSEISLSVSSKHLIQQPSSQPSSYRLPLIVTRLRTDSAVY